MEIVIDRGILFITAIPAFIIFRAIKLITNKTIDMKQELIKNAFVIYLILLIDIMIFPITIKTGQNSTTILQRANINLIPFIKYFNTNIILTTAIKNILGNITILMPLTIFMYTLNDKYKNIKSCIKLTFYTSLSIELTQLTFNLFLLNIPQRLIDIEDIILNTLGSIVAYYITNYTIKTYKEYKEKLNKQQKGAVSK